METKSKGGRPATGYIQWRRHAKTGVMQWHAQVSLCDGTRPFVALDPKIQHGDCCDAPSSNCEHRQQARVCAQETSDYFRKHGAISDPTRETVEHYAKRWCKWRKTEGLGCVAGDLALLNRHVFPEIGGFDVRHVARDDLKRLVTKLDAKAKVGKSDDGKSFGPKTAINAWGTVRALFRDAQKAKDVSLCVREDNPADGVAGPDEGAKKAKTYLWPSEFVALVTSDRVPRRWKRLFSLAVYLYMRAGELRALKWDDVDLEHGTILVHVAEDRVRKRGVKATKSETARRIPIEPALLPLLEAMHKAAGGEGRVFKMPSTGGLSRKLKTYLARAGVKRSELFVKKDATRKAITFHDLRATGITWMAARGDDPLRIMQRAGHEDFETTKLYMREAENLSASFGDVFPALPDALLGFANDSQRCDTDEANVSELLQELVELTGIETADESAPKAEKMASSSPPGRNSVCETLDTIEARILDKIADAELAGRSTVVEALLRRLEAHRRAAPLPDNVLRMKRA